MEHASPEAPARELMYRVANARQLLEIALAAENRARDFFVAVARTTGSRALRELSSLFAAEELEHVRMVQEAMEAYGRGGPDWEALMGEGVGPGIVTPG
jgi:rubrerythrin